MPSVRSTTWRRIRESIRLVSRSWGFRWAAKPPFGQVRCDFKNTAKGAGRFAAHLAFYPSGCITRLAEEDRVSGAPIRIFHGAADDWTLMGPCKSYVERLRQTGKDATLTEYPDAHHAFDNPGAPLRKLPNIVIPRNCAFVEENGRVVDATTRGSIAFSSCWSRGASIGYNADAHRKAVNDVEAILRPLFGLK